MKILVLGLLSLSLSISSVAFGSPQAERVRATFCGFFLDKKPVTVEIKSDRTANMTYDGQSYALTVSDYKLNGVPHGYACDDSAFCVTSIEYKLTGPGADFTITDDWSAQTSTAYGRNDNIPNFHTLNGVCE